MCGKSVLIIRWGGEKSVCRANLLSKVVRPSVSSKVKSLAFFFDEFGFFSMGKGVTIAKNLPFFIELHTFIGESGMIVTWV